MKGCVICGTFHHAVIKMFINDSFSLYIFLKIYPIGDYHSQNSVLQACVLQTEICYSKSGKWNKRRIGLPIIVQIYIFDCLMQSFIANIRKWL